MLAPPLSVQIDHLEAITSRRRAAWDRYDGALREQLAASGTRVLEGRGGSAHTFALVLPRPELRPPVLAHLASAGVHATSHFEPLHDSPVGRRLDPDRRCPGSTRLAASIVRLPLFDALGEDQQRRVIDAVVTAPLA
jgi:dTDP-4-amino-4,6-dideoxygalactose transaminase